MLRIGSYTKSEKYMRLGEQQMDEKQWSRDWSMVDWNEIRQKLDFAEEAEKEGLSHGQIIKAEIGITKDEFEEYMIWLCENKPDEFEKTIFMMGLREAGMSMEEAQYFADNPDIFKKALDYVQNKQLN